MYNTQKFARLLLQQIQKVRRKYFVCETHIEYNLIKCTSKAVNLYICVIS
jgi:hypothetical protein